jgi:hypothetical protein
MKRAVFLSVVILFAASALGQIHGVPASVTSITPSNHTPGVGASVTSLGPWGYRSTPVPSGGWGNASRFSHLPYQPPTSFSCFGAGVVCVPTTSTGVNGSRRHHGRNSYYGGYPYAGYGYTGYPVYTMDYGTGSYEPDYEPAAEAEPPAPTIFERRSTTRPYAREEPSYGNDYQAQSAPQQESQSHSSVIGVGGEETTTLVFRDGRKFDIHNYAIVGGSIFNFDGTGPFKTQLAELDVPATVKLNEDHGVIFKLPTK